VFVPEPLRGCLITSYTTSTVSAHELVLLFPRQTTQILSKARTNDDHIALLELDTLLLSNGFDVLDRDIVGIERIELDPVLVGISLVIDKDTARNKTATLVPVIQRWELLIMVLIAMVLGQFLHVRLNAVVAHGAFLVVEVAQTVPLTGALGIELDFVVVAVGVQRGVDEGHDLVD